MEKRGRIGKTELRRLLDAERGVLHRSRAERGGAKARRSKPRSMRSSATAPVLEDLRAQVEDAAAARGEAA